MELILTILFSVSIHACFAGLPRRLPTELVIQRGRAVIQNDLTKPNTSPDCLIDDAVARTNAPTSYKYLNYRPLIMKGWERDEGSILAMVNEAAYVFKYAEYASTAFKKEKAKDRCVSYNKRILDDVQLCCSQILTLTKAKVFELRTKDARNPDLGEQSLNAFASGKNMIEGAEGTHCQEKMEKGQLSPHFYAQRSLVGIEERQSVRPYGTALELRKTVDNVIQCLRECILKIKHDRKFYKDRFWRTRFEQAIFQGIEYLYKYNYVQAREMAVFFEGDELLEITGCHIKNAICFTESSFPFPRRPQKEYLMMDWNVDYLRHCLGGLKDDSQSLVIHTAFSESYKHLQRTWGSENNWPKLNSILGSLTKADFLKNLSAWKPNSKDSEQEITLNNHVAQLITQFLEPDKHFTESEEYLNVEAYKTNTILLEFFVSNLSPEQSLEKFLGKEQGRYKQFQSQLELFTTGENIALLSERERILKNEMASGNEGLISQKQLHDEIEYIKNEKQKLQEKFKEMKKIIRSDTQFNSCTAQAIVTKVTREYDPVPLQMKRDFLLNKSSQ